MATVTWNGGSGVWSLGGSSWSGTDMYGNSLPSYAWNNSEALATFNPSAATDVTISGPVVAHGVVIASGATGYVFNGSNGGVLTTTGSGIVAHESATFNVDVKIGAPQTWTIDSGKSLVIGGYLHTIISPLTLTSNGDTTISGSIDGGGTLNSMGDARAIAMNGSGTLHLTGAATYSVPLTLSSGYLSFEQNGASIANYTGVISGGGNGWVSKSNTGTVILSGANTYNCWTRLYNGVVQADVGVGLPSQSSLILNGGVFQSNSTTTYTDKFRNETSGTNRWLSWWDGGFAGGGGTLTVNLRGNGSAVDWTGNGDTGIGNSMKFGSPTAQNPVIFQNGLNLDGAVRAIYVDNNPNNANNYALMSGVIGNGAGGSASGLVKNGPGRLILTAVNTYGDGQGYDVGATQINQGELQADRGVGYSSNSGLILNGGVLQSNKLALRIGAGAGALEPLVAVERPAVIPLSFAQNRLWFVDQLQGPSAIYNMAVGLRLTGRLDAEPFGAALADVVARHESLRTLFPAVEGVPQQLVVALEQADVDWQFIDAAGWSASQLEQAIDTAVRDPFDLAAQIPLRARLFRITDDEHVLVAVVHHIAADGVSIAPLVRDLGVAYASRCAGQAPAWAPLAVQYADYTLWQRAQLGDLSDSDSPIAGQLAYWEDALAGMPERLQLPTDRPYPPVADYRGARVVVDWPVELQQRIAQVAREHNATTFMVVQAALAALLSKLSASSEVAVGFSIAGRSDPVLDELVGFFVNTLVLRVDVAGDPSVAELLAQVRGRSLAAYEHQDVPFEVLVERLNPTRSLTHHPLVQVVLAWQNFARQENGLASGLALGDLQVAQLPVDTCTARMDLTFALGEQWTDAGEPAGIGGTVEFRTDVFDAASIESLIERLERLLVALTADPTRRLSSIDLLDEAERVRLDGWGNRAALMRPVPPAASIPASFATQVAHAPEAVAVTCGERSWSYRELDEASNRLAHLLIGHGAGPGECVALMLSRSAEAIAAILAVLKTGAAYLPIDPAHPDARIEFMVADAAPMAVITTADLRSRLDARDMPIIDIDDPAIDAQPSTALPALAAENIAYLIYTSGTTGVPKGVAVTHHNVIRLLRSLDAEVPRAAVWSQCHSLAFDFSVWEIWGALLGGGRLVVVPSRWPAHRKTSTPC